MIEIAKCQDQENYNNIVLSKVNLLLKFRVIILFGKPCFRMCLGIQILEMQYLSPPAGSGTNSITKHMNVSIATHVDTDSEIVKGV